MGGETGKSHNSRAESGNPLVTPSPDISQFLAEYLVRLSLTPRFSGVENVRCGSNCFNSFGVICETVETVPLHETASYTPLKRGVNEIRRNVQKNPVVRPEPCRRGIEP